MRTVLGFQINMKSKQKSFTVIELLVATPYHRLWRGTGQVAQKRNGFTVIELLVAIAVVGLLASIVLVALDIPGTRRKAQIAKSLQFSQSIHNALGADIVGYWNFENVSANTARDMSGYGNDGTIYGATPATGVELPGGGGTGMALQFDGVDDYVDIPDSADWDFGSGPVSFSFWIRLNDTSASSFFLTQRSGGTAGGFEFYYSGSADQLIVNYSNLGSSIFKTWTDPGNNWHHIAYTRLENRHTLYVDGLSIGSSVESSAFANVAGVLRIGGYNLTGIYELDGSIDEVRIYNQALALGQIQQHYVEGLPRHKLTRR